MIGKLTGIIDSFDNGKLILDVQGVGYIVAASSRTLGRIGREGDPTTLLIEMQVREDSMTLFGFADAAERHWFRLLTGVQGVGAKVALSILSACPPDRLSIAIASQDKAVLTQADGVGPKLAARLLTELKDKAASLELGKYSKPADINVSRETKDQNPAVDNDAVSALVNLGYAKADAYTAVMRVKSENDNHKDNLQSLIRLALKELSA